MLSGNCQAGPYLYLVDTRRPASTTPNMDPPDNYQTTYDSKTKNVVFDSLIVFCLHQAHILFHVARGGINKF